MGSASKKHMGRGVQGKGDGTGAMTDIDPDMVGANDVLSNRDKALHPHSRGLDSRNVQTEQMRDHATNRQVDE